MFFILLGDTAVHTTMMTCSRQIMTLILAACVPVASSFVLAVVGSTSGSRSLDIHGQTSQASNNNHDPLLLFMGLYDEPLPTERNRGDSETGDTTDLDAVFER